MKHASQLGGWALVNTYISIAKARRSFVSFQFASLDILPYSKIVLTYVFKLFWDLHSYDQGQCSLKSAQSVLLLRMGICNGCLLPPGGECVSIWHQWQLISSSFQAPVLCGLTSWMERRIGNYASQWPAHRGCQLLQ